MKEIFFPISHIRFYENCLALKIDASSGSVDFTIIQDELSSSARTFRLRFAGSKVSERLLGWHEKTEHWRGKRKATFTRSAISNRVVKDCGSYGVYLCAYVQHPASSHWEIFFRSSSLCIFFLLFFYLALIAWHAFFIFSYKSLHPRAIYERFTSRVKDTCPPVSYSNQSSRHKHRFTHGIFHDSIQIHWLGIFMMLLKEITIKKLINFYDEISLYIFCHIGHQGCLFSSIDCLFYQYIFETYLLLAPWDY